MSNLETHAPARNLEQEAYDRNADYISLYATAGGLVIAATGAGSALALEYEAHTADPVSATLADGMAHTITVQGREMAQAACLAGAGLGIMMSIAAVGAMIGRRVRSAEKRARHSDAANPWKMNPAYERDY